MKRSILGGTFVVTMLIIVMGSVLAQDYKIGPGDELSVTFWQEPQLNSTVRVDQKGAILLPVVGSVTAAGFTTNELALKIVRKIAVFNQNISQAAVTVTQYGSNTVYVTGSVMTPGKYSFEVIPDLWRVILEAGGPTESALLSEIQIIRGGDKAGQMTTADLSEFLSGGDLSKLPRIYAGDAIRVPGVIGAGTGSETSTTVPSQGTGTIYIYGQVAKPGTYSYAHNLTLLEAIVIAGGPNLDAKMGQVKVITKGNPYSSVATVDLEKYSKMGTPAPFLLRPGDTIFIPQRKFALASQTFQQGVIGQFLGVFGSVAAAILIYKWVE